MVGHFYHILCFVFFASDPQKSSLRKHHGKSRKCWWFSTRPSLKQYSVSIVMKKRKLKQGVDWLILWCLMPFSTVFQLCHTMLSWSSFNHIILSKPQAAFPHNYCWNNGQRWERNESSHNDHHQSLERILAKLGIEPVISCSQVW